MRFGIGRVSAVFLSVALLLAGCAEPVRVERESALRYSAAHVARADTIVVLVPGALASVTLYGPRTDWESDGVAVVEYRFPGYDGLPFDRKVLIRSAGVRIAQLLNRWPEKRVRLVGFSTGAAIAIEAGARMQSGDVQVAAVSSAVPFPGMLGVGPRSFREFLRAVAVTGTLDRTEVWLEYFKTLLYGRDWDKQPETRDFANDFVKRFRQTIYVPADGVGRAHSQDLLGWTLSPEVRANPPQVRFYHGVNDTIVPIRLVRDLAGQLGGAEVVSYEPDAHLLMLTRPGVLGQVRRDLGIGGG